MRKLLLATNNHGKLIEFQDLLKDFPFDLITPATIGLILDVPELGSTYTENASSKAKSFAEASGLVSLADDSGLEVDALAGQPGLHSRRFGPGQNATDAERRAYLLQRLLTYPQPWTARFRCVVAVAVPGGSTRTADGYCPGVIIPNERGQNGFGYDPIFLLTDLDKTMAELTMEEKNERSHRARAVQAAHSILTDI